MGGPAWLILTELLGSVERASQLIREKIESRLTSGPDGLRRAFQFFDKDGSGSISLPEFDKALKEYIMLDLDEPTVRGCFERFDDDGTVSILSTLFLKSSRFLMVPSFWTSFVDHFFADQCRSTKSSF